MYAVVVYLLYKGEISGAKFSGRLRVVHFNLYRLTEERAEKAKRWYKKIKDIRGVR